MAVCGIGGFLFRANDPEALRAWYAAHLGIGGGEHGVWFPDAGPSVFAPMDRGSELWPQERGWMLNLRVTELDQLCESLSAAGIAVIRDAAWDVAGVGRFARIEDPDGNPMELWEPHPSA